MNKVIFRWLMLAGLILGMGLGMGLGVGAAQAQLPGRRGAGGLTQPPTIGGGMNSPNTGLGQQTVSPQAVGLPGAEVDEDSVAPAGRLASEMGPTEALFDAINRGDIVAARGAINRGADLRERSPLGFSPVELAVDLARKDIAFLLLSMRGIDERGQIRAARPVAEPSAVERAGAVKQEAQRQGAARVAPGPGPVAPQGPRLFAGDGGPAVPEAGFLGFDGGARTRAR
ncbi:MAG: hypothetical protein EXR05_12010 [Acetobacteraceae bacterium]|nr:hypothetical protein [Acetobacteraceae bacterium]